MFRQSVRRLTTTAFNSAEVASKVDISNQYGVQLAKAQGHVNGFVGGESSVTSHVGSVDLNLQPLATLLSFASNDYPTKQAARS